MKLVYFSKTDKSILTVSGELDRHFKAHEIKSTHLTKIESLENMLQQLVLQADKERVDLFYANDTQVQVTKMLEKFGFRLISTGVLFRKHEPYSSLAAEPVGTEYLVEDYVGNYKVTSNEAKATHIARTNLYGQRLVIESATVK